MLLYVFNRSPGFPLFSTFFLVEISSRERAYPAVNRIHYSGLKGKAGLSILCNPEPGNRGVTAAVGRIYKAIKLHNFNFNIIYRQ